MSRFTSLLTAALAVACLGGAAWGARPLALAAGWGEHTGLPLLAAAATLAGCLGVGHWIRRRVSPDLFGGDGLSQALLALGLGVAVVQLLVLVLGVGGLAGELRLRVLFVLLVGVGLHALRRPGLGGPTSPGLAAGLTLAGALLLPSLLSVGAPPLGADEGQYHRRFVEALLRTGSFAGDPLDPTSGLVQGLHGLAAIPASWVGVAAMRPLAWLLALAGLATGERVLRRAVGRGAAIYPLIAVGAASLVAALPVFNTDATGALFVGLVALVALDAAQAPSTPGGRFGLLGVLGGGALLIKFSAPLFLAPFWLMLGLRLLADSPGRARGAALARLVGSAAVPLLFVLPWLLRNQALFGHPLHPLAGLAAPPGLEAAFPFNFGDHYGPGRGTAALLRTPWDLFALGREFDRRLFLGRLNPWPLVAIPGLLLLLRERAGRRLLLPVALGGLFWSLALRRVVYLLPLWPLIAAAAAGGLATAVRAGRGAQLGALLVAAVAIAEVAAPLERQIDDAAVAAGQATWDEVAESRSVEAAPLAWLRANAAPDDAIAFAWAWSSWELPQRTLYLGAEEFTPFRIAVRTAGDAHGLAEHFRAEGVRWVVHRELPFHRSSFPSLSDAEFAEGFAKPRAIVDEFVRLHGRLRFEHGPIQVFELAAKKP